MGSAASHSHFPPHLQRLLDSHGVDVGRLSAQRTQKGLDALLWHPDFTSQVKKEILAVLVPAPPQPDAAAIRLRQMQSEADKLCRDAQLASQRIDVLEHGTHEWRQDQIQASHRLNALSKNIDQLAEVRGRQQAQLTQTTYPSYGDGNQEERFHNRYN